MSLTLRSMEGWDDTGADTGRQNGDGPQDPLVQRYRTRKETRAWPMYLPRPKHRGWYCAIAHTRGHAPDQPCSRYPPRQNTRRTV